MRTEPHAQAADEPAVNAPPLVGTWRGPDIPAPRARDAIKSVSKLRISVRRVMMMVRIEAWHAVGLAMVAPRMAAVEAATVADYPAPDRRLRHLGRRQSGMRGVACPPSGGGQSH